MKLYRMYAETDMEEYVEPGDEILALKKGCQSSEFQFLDHSPIEVEISEEGGLEFPDFLLKWNIPLISEKFRQLLDQAGVDNLFYKPIRLKDETLGRNESYYLALPPRIRCIDFERSILEPEDPDLPPEYQIYQIEKLVLDQGKIGNYKIFKLADIAADDHITDSILVTEDLKEFLENKLENVYFQEMRDEDGR